ncbi:MAG TPA: DNA helicase RecQ [Gemmataceae bacterium]|nr:DNA helicase RecQ [Gemmataceae bacterium]
MSAAPGPWSLPDLLATIERHWGFRSLRPLQEQAMRAVLDGRDSLVVLPTGGGKSLCYQAPAVVRGATTVVVSPLISLMKDQVDSLRACGVPAVQLDSSQGAVERFGYEHEIREGGVRLVFLSPERLVQTDLYRVLQQVGVRTFAIDEAHCISHWGHDFRPEYRQLNRLREFFPGASVHAYTATATERVRHDIIRQLGLQEPEVLVGNFDRANLTYRVVPRRDLLKQALEVIDRHPHEAGIIYCIRRADVDDLAAALRKHGLKALPYHAGLSGEERAWTQEEFTAERCDLIVATVAFGMGIDRSNVRFVLHAAMPKSVEHYQQEAGRAGRDGLEAECVLLYSGADTLLWKSIVEKSAADAEAAVDPAFLPAALAHVEDMDRYCRGAVCRHRALVNYFGQPYEAESCGACDLCLGETELVPDGAVVAQKILSCVARVRERFGIGHIVSVLRGENTDNVRKRGHDKLSTFGLLAGHGKADVRDWVYQLLGQQVLVQAGDEYPVLHLNAASWEVMRGQRPVRLVRLARGKKKEKARAEAVSWDGVDQGLFEALRRLRRQLAEERQVPPYIVFTDATLRQLARLRPTTPEQMRQASGVGEAKLRDFGAAVLEVIRTHGGPTSAAGAVTPPPADDRERAFALFRRGTPVEKAMQELGQGRGDVMNHLYDFVRAERPKSLVPWVPEGKYQRVAAAARRFGTGRLQPILVALGDEVTSETVRLVLAHLQR